MKYLHVLSGRATFEMGDHSDEAEFASGYQLFFERNAIHALPTLLKKPAIFLSLDSPRRRPEDITFVDSDDCNAGAFIAGNKPA